MNTDSQNKRSAVFLLKMIYSSAGIMVNKVKFMLHTRTRSCTLIILVVVVVVWHLSSHMVRANDEIQKETQPTVESTLPAIIEKVKQYPEQYAVFIANNRDLQRAFEFELSKRKVKKFLDAAHAHASGKENVPEFKKIQDYFISRVYLGNSHCMLDTKDFLNALSKESLENDPITIDKHLHAAFCSTSDLFEKCHIYGRPLPWYRRWPRQLQDRVVALYTPAISDLKRALIDNKDLELMAQLVSIKELRTAYKAVTKGKHNNY